MWTEMYPAVSWTEVEEPKDADFIRRHVVRLLDQRRIPGAVEFREYSTAAEVALAIRDMVVRGAPAIGIAGGYALALEAERAEQEGRKVSDEEGIESGYKVLLEARPTAVNLRWALDRVRAVMRKETSTAKDVAMEAMRIHEEDVESNRRMAEFGAELIRDGDNVLTHCHTGGMATGGWGTALGVFRTAYCEQKKKIHCWVDETRPRSQGARLTAWELGSFKIPMTLIVDSAAGLVMRQGRVQSVFVGADRIAANGDTANKIGTYSVAVLAKQHSIPFYVVAPVSTVDLATPNGDKIPIEERTPIEVTQPTRESSIAPSSVKVYNPAFDITPAELITAIITERGVIRPPLDRGLLSLVS